VHITLAMEKRKRMSHPKTQRLDDDQTDILIRIFDEDGFAGLSPYQDWVMAALHEWSEIRDSIAAASFAELRSEVVQLRSLVQAMKFSDHSVKIAKVRAALIKMHDEVTSDLGSGAEWVQQRCRNMIAMLSDDIVDGKAKI
ncbi:MAG: hypothetical protein ACM358_14055, partial [Gemmatimonadota bacterium]